MNQSRSSAIITVLTLSVSSGLGLTSPASEAPPINELTHNLRHRTLDWVAPSFPCSPENCPSATHQCLANPNHPQRTTDDVCSPCQSGQSYWPCDVPGLCYCWDSSNGDSQIPPAPSTKSVEEGGPLENSSMGNYVFAVSNVDPCDILTEEVFKSLAPTAVAPYTYAGFCEAVSHYNANHPSEGVFNMGSEMNQRMELAAFFGNALHESDEFKAGREYLMCADQIIRGSETYCKPCDVGSFDWDTMKCSASLASEGRAFNGYCQSNLLPPDACMCDDVYEEEGDLAGYVKADKVYFGRGSIQLSWNYNYIRASVALTGAPETFCQRPDLVATKEEYAWGAGLFYWMENMKNDKTCHQSVLMNSDFGETLDNINGGLECPADESGWHNTAVQLRLNRYCRAATALGLDRLLSLDGCLEMDKKMEQCLEEGNCDDCQAFVGKIGLLEGSGGSGANAVEADSGTAEEVEVSSDAPAEEATTQQDEPTGAALLEPPLETEKPSNEPSPKPTHSPTKLYIPQGPCSGEPCFIPPEVKNDPNSTLQFCRNSEGICGAGEAYCNAGSTWTSFCHDCDVDSPYGCPTYGCSDCTGESQICVGNLNGFNPISDEDCAACSQGQQYWPCDITTAEGCWCYDTNLPRVEPAAPSGLEVADKGNSASATIGQGVCGVIIDETLFNTLAPNAISPFTYQGFCESVDHYNSHHAEKVFRMGSYQERLSELAAFLGIASHETNGFVASREYLACGDNKEVDGVLYCKPCAVGDYNYDTHTCSVSMLAGDQSYMNFCQPYTSPPQGCACSYVKQVEATGDLEGHMRADDIFFGRGSIQLSHNFNYIRASATMTGSEQTFCSHPEMLASVETYSWGVGLYLWMDGMSKEGLTSHVSVLKAGNFGGALNITNGGSECPVKEDDTFYSKAVVNRIDHYCNSAQVLGVPKLLELSGCEGLEDVFSSCMANGGCPHCEYWNPDAVHTASPIIPDPTVLSTAIAATPTSNQNRPIQNPEDQQGTANVETSTTSTETIETDHITTVATTVVTTSQETTIAPPPTLQPSISPMRGPSRKPRTKRPSDAPSSKPSNTPSASPTPSPTKEEGDKVPDQTSANQFALLDLTVGGYDVSDNEPQEATDNKPQETSFSVTSQSHSFAVTSQSSGIDAADSGPSHADSFAVVSHSKGSNSGTSSATRTKHPSSSPVATTPQTTVSTPSPISENSPPKVEEMEPLSGGLTNWALTTLDDQNEGHDRTESLGEMTNWALTPLDNQNDSATDSPTKSPVKNAINVQEIVFHPPSKSDGSLDQSVSEHKKQEPKAALGVDDEGMNINDVGTIVAMSGSKMADTGTISGRVWIENEEGDEVGMRGILVDIFKCEDDDWVEGTRTASAGDYIFDELIHGEYYVRVTAASRYSFNDDSSDSNVDSDGKSECIELSSTQSSHAVNAGLVKLTVSSVSESNIDVHKNGIDSVEAETAAIDAADDLPDNCKGQPCSGREECRSRFNSCGKGEEYCNSDSQWMPDCGTRAPTGTPTIAPSSAQPTFVVDLQTQCSGEPCIDGDGKWCRSEVGFCGEGNLYCNSESLWIPECAPSKSPSEVKPSQVNSTIAEMVSNDSEGQVPSFAPSQGERTDTTGFSSFALPTLTEITPNQAATNHVSIAGHERTSIKSNDVLSAAVDRMDEDKHAGSDTNPASQKKNSVVDSSWYEKYAYLDSLTASSGLRSTSFKTLLLLSWPFGLLLEFV